jgi:hypothetical protein
MTRGPQRVVARRHVTNADCIRANTYIPIHIHTYTHTYTHNRAHMRAVHTYIVHCT